MSRACVAIYVMFTFAVAQVGVPLDDLSNKFDENVREVMNKCVAGKLHMLSYTVLL